MIAVATLHVGLFPLSCRSFVLSGVFLINPMFVLRDSCSNLERMIPSVFLTMYTYSTLSYYLYSAHQLGIHLL